MMFKEQPNLFLAKVNDCKKLLCEDAELQDYFFGVVIMAADIYNIKDRDDKFFKIFKEEVKRLSKMID